MKEEFKLYTPENSYTEFEVSNFGYVRNVDTNNIIGSVNNKGYRYFSYPLHDGRAKVCYIGNLVVKLFKRAAKYNKQIIYKDGDKSNCRADNVMWANREYYVKSRLENVRRMGQTSKHPGYRLFSDDKVRAIRRMTRPIANIALRLNTSYGVIRNLKKGLTYKDVK